MQTREVFVNCPSSRDPYYRLEAELCRNSSLDRRQRDAYAYSFINDLDPLWRVDAEPEMIEATKLVGRQIDLHKTRFQQNEIDLPATWKAITCVRERLIRMASAMILPPLTLSSF